MILIETAATASLQTPPTSSRLASPLIRVMLSPVTNEAALPPGPLAPAGGRGTERGGRQRPLPEATVMENQPLLLRYLTAPRVPPSPSPLPPLGGEETLGQRNSSICDNPSDAGGRENSVKGSACIRTKLSSARRQDLA
jgi:hypothetical protein